MDEPYRMRAVLVPLDPTPAQEQLLRSYCGASRFAYNWTVAIAKANLDTREEERRSGVNETDLTKLSWSAWSMTPLWNSVKEEVAPWHRDVTKHAFRSGVTNATVALKNYDESKKGLRKGQPVEFPKFKNRRSKQSFTLIEFTRSCWISEDSRHVRLILPRFATHPRITRRREQLQWLHTTESLHRLKKKVDSGEWTIQSVTISFTGGRWQASFLVRQYVIAAPPSVRQREELVGVDLGVKHLATLSKPVKGVSDDSGHIANPHHLDAELVRLAKLDRQLSRCQKGSKNHGKVRLRRQLTYKVEDRGHRVVVVNRYHPSSKKCSHCGVTKAKFAITERVFECSNCGISLDRDVNAACNIRDEGLRLLTNEASTVAGHQPETLNAVSRDRETKPLRRGRGDRYQSRTTQPYKDLTISA